MKTYALPLLLLPFLAACEVGPDYVRPSVETPAAFKEVGNWSPAQPQDDANRGSWWLIYKDTVLSDLEQQVEVSNQNLKAAEAAYRASTSIVEETESSLFPGITAGASATRSGTGQPRVDPKNTLNLSTAASWTPDIWGGIRRSVESSEANAEASAAQLASARLSAQGALATDYFALRIVDRLKQLLDQTVADDKKILDIVRNQYEAGVAAKSDVLSAQTQLESVQASAINTGVQRAQLEHAIAVLIGKPPSEFSLPALEKFTTAIPHIPVGVPSELLQRRPDIASQERQMAAANAEIGVQTAAWFPDITLSTSAGTTAAAIGKILQASSGVWSVGPSLAETIFDAGLRQSRIEEAEATYDESVANYRQTVLTAFQQVEDNLASLRVLEEEANVESAAVSDARHAEMLTLNQYKEGIIPYNTVLTAQTVTLSNEQQELTVLGNRLASSVALIQALGGGWDGKLAK
jgi:NodT family efflux transporter outer membrane factor (OMF) lipoprotein